MRGTFEKKCCQSLAVVNGDVSLSRCFGMIASLQRCSLQLRYFVAKLNSISHQVPKIMKENRIKSSLFRTSTNKANPEGRSLLRLCYDPYYRSSLIQNLEGIGIERDAAGIPYMEIPVDYMNPKASDAQKAIYAQAQNIVTNMRNNQ